MGWTHRICADCWNSRNPNRQPVVITEDCRQPEICCFCGKETTAGIFVRHDQKELKCNCK